MEIQKETVKDRGNDERSIKKTIREQIIRRLGEQSSCERKRKSSKIYRKMIALEEFRDAKTVLAYISLPEEVDTWDIIREALKKGKRVGVPYLVAGDVKMIASEIKVDQRLEKGPFGILQPSATDVKAIPLGEIDLVIVPALAYDRKNRRLGRGKGCYDFFLSGKKKQSLKTTGVAFGFQVLDDLPQDPHDKTVDRVITDLDG